MDSEPEEKKHSDLILNSRFYEQKLPAEGDLVMVEVLDVIENGATVALLEYDNIEGMITPNEFSKVGNMKIALKSIKKGRQEIVKVLRVDKEKGYIDLSKKSVSSDDTTTRFEERFEKAKRVHSILRNVAEKCSLNIEELYIKIAWPLYKSHHHAFDAFKMAIENNDIFKDLQVSADIKEKLLVEIKRRLTPQAVKIRAEFEITCFGYDGIDAIKEALKAGLKLSTPFCDIKFQVSAAPLYWAITNTFDKTIGIKGLNDALAVVEELIKSKHGTFLLKTHPTVIGEKDVDLALEDWQKYNSHTEDEEDDGMGDADIGVNTEEVDKFEESKKHQAEYYEEDHEEKKKI